MCKKFGHHGCIVHNVSENCDETTLVVIHTESQRLCPLKTQCMFQASGFIVRMKAGYLVLKKDFKLAGETKK